jgi:radical SAM protein with 4Fe4S-binding SPASM domain
LSEPLAAYHTIFNQLISGIDKVLGRSRLLAKPLRIHLEINDICNLRCIMCARENPTFPKGIGELSLGAVERLVPWLRSATYVGIAGNGEPFLHKDLFAILRLVTSHGAIPSVITNATLLSAENVNELVSVGESILLVSLDGGTKETFEAIRRGARFDAVFDGLRRLTRVKKERHSPYPIVNIIVCLLRQNMGELKRIIDIAAEVNAPVVIFQNALPYSPGAAESIITDQPMIERVIQEVRAYARQHGIMVQYVPLGVGLKRRAEDNPRTPSRRLFCENIWQQLHVEVTGNVRYCCFWTGGAAGNILTQSVDEIWNSEGFQDLRRQLARGKIPPDCEKCHVLSFHNSKAILRDTYTELRRILRR